MLGEKFNTAKPFLLPETVFISPSASAPTATTPDIQVQNMIVVNKSWQTDYTDSLTNKSLQNPLRFTNVYTIFILPIWQ